MFTKIYRTGLYQNNLSVQIKPDKKVHTARLLWTLHQEHFVLVGSQTLDLTRKTKTGKSRHLFRNKKLPRLDCLGALALNVTTVFASKNFVLFRKTPPHSARAPLEPKARLSPCGSRPTLDVLYRTRPDTRSGLVNKKLPRLDSNQQPTG